MIEKHVVKDITNQLEQAGRYYINVHGSNFSKNGTPDLITFDSKKIFVGIEVKMPNKQPVVNQWRQGIKILKAGGRFVVGYDDFDINKLDNHTLPIVKVGGEIGESEFEAMTIKLTGTSEIKLRK